MYITKQIIRVLVLGITMMSTSMLYAQEYICLKEDMRVSSASTDNTVQLFKYSTIEVSPTLKCRIEKMTPEAENRENTKGSGLKQQAIFEVISYNDSLPKLKFKDNKGAERYNVNGVSSINCYYSTLVNGKEYLIPYDKSLKKTTVKKHPEDYPKLLFTYDTVQNALYYYPNSDRFRMPSGAKLVLDDSRQVGLNIATTIPKVEKNVRLRLITSSDTSCFEDVFFTTANVSKVAMFEPTPDNTFVEWLKHNWIWVVTIVLMIVGCMVLFVHALLRVKRKRKLELHSDHHVRIPDVQDNDSSNIETQFAKINEAIEKIAPAIKSFSEIEEKNVKLQNDITHCNDVIDHCHCEIFHYQKEIEEREIRINELESTLEHRDVSIMEKEKELTECKEQLNVTRKKYNDIIKENERLSAACDKLEKTRNESLVKIKELEEKSKQDKVTICNLANHLKIDEDSKVENGTIRIPNGKTFAVKAIKILNECTKGETLIQQYISSLSNNDKERMSYFMSAYIKDNPFGIRDKWVVILSLLTNKENFDTAEYNNTLRIPKGIDSLEWLKYQFVEELLERYLSPLLIMLEQIRCADKYGITASVPANVKDIIYGIIESNRSLGITINHVPLFEQIHDYENIMVDLKIPEELENLIVDKKEGVPLFLKKIGIGTEKSRENKTIIIALL